MQKYGSAKAISSDMLFGNDQNVSWQTISYYFHGKKYYYSEQFPSLQSGPDANLNRFQGSSSISSAEYFGRQELSPQGRGSITTPDLDDVKESVRQGVSKVAGRLSNLASGAMTQLQVRFD